MTSAEESKKTTSVTELSDDEMAAVSGGFMQAMSISVSASMQQEKVTGYVVWCMGEGAIFAEEEDAKRYYNKLMATKNYSKVYGQNYAASEWARCACAFNQRIADCRITGKDILSHEAAQRLF